MQTYSNTFNVSKIAAKAHDTSIWWPVWRRYVPQLLTIKQTTYVGSEIIKKGKKQ